MLNEKNQQQSEALRSEISGLLDFQNFSIGMIEGKLNNRIELASWELRELYFSTSDSIETANLKSIAALIGMDTLTESIEVIREDGNIINSTDDSAIGKNAFEQGDDIKKYIKNVLANNDFVLEDFSINLGNRKLEKWSYQSSVDQKYVIRLNVVSKEVNALSEAVKKIISEISKNREEVLSMDIFVNPSFPYSFASDLELTEGEASMIRSIFLQKKDSLITESTDEREIGTFYVYSEREGSTLTNSFVVRLRKDLTLQKDLLRNNLIRKIGLFAFGLLVLFVILLINTNFITRPIKLVSSAALSVGSGHLSKRVPEMGNKELMVLAKSFNKMASDLESSDRKIRRQKAKIEEAHKEIKSSITYARRIQSAILPPLKLVEQHLPDSFVLYKPKDIIAGDFYWLEVTENDVLIAAADCTGHGVPGAMVSVVCNNALNRSVREFGLTDPGLILDKTREMVIEEFEKSEEDVMDGMDVALCAFSGYRLRYAGAHNPLWLVRNGELTEIRASKQPIGVYHNITPFQTHHIDLLPGDSIYIFSDGFADQFGGDRGKKFMSARFKKLIVSIQSESMPRQKELLNKAIKEWKGRRDQVDDICVIGVRVGH